MRVTYKDDPTIAEVREFLDAVQWKGHGVLRTERIAVALLFRLEDEEQENDRHGPTCCESEYCDCDCGYMQRVASRRERAMLREKEWKR